jgi:hypothetical protein
MATPYDILNGSHYTCVLCSGDEVLTTDLRGVKPLVRWLMEGRSFQGFSAADKVVGKATAFLYCLLGVSDVHALVMSQSALAVLQSNGIEARYDTLVEHIINRKGDGICPFEAVVMEIKEPQDALPVILEKMAQMGISLE